MLAKGKAIDYPATVATTWEMSFQAVAKASPAAAQLLTLCAFLAADDIPLDLLRPGAEHLPPALAAALADELATADMIAELLRYSLVKARDESLSLHRLVQTVVRGRLDEDEGKDWAGQTVRLVRAVYRFGDTDLTTWGPAERLLSHAEAAAGWAEKAGVKAEATASAISKARLRRSKFLAANRNSGNRVPNTAE